VILLTGIVVGVAMGMACGGTLRNLAAARLTGETALLLLLLAQAALPVIAAVGTAGRTLIWIWIATCAAVAGMAVVNLKHPGMALVAAGLLMNLLVVGLNGAMPVDVSSARVLDAARSRQLSAGTTGDWLHSAGGGESRLPLLADVIPVPGPRPVRALVSPGDVLMAAGIAAFLAASMMLRRTTGSRRSGSPESLPG
jgi:Family of unknown function (DUF5317)